MFGNGEYTVESQNAMPALTVSTSFVDGDAACSHCAPDALSLARRKKAARDPVSYVLAENFSAGNFAWVRKR